MKLAPTFYISLAICSCSLTLSFVDKDLLVTTPYIWGQHEYWRWITANLVHLTWPHFLINTAGLLLFTMALFQQMSNERYLYLFVFMALVVGVGVNLLKPTTHYAGLSGVLHGLIVAGCFYASNHSRWKRILLFVLTLGKIAQEQFVEQYQSGHHPIFTFNISYDAHLLGAIAGLTFVLVDIVITKHIEYRKLPKDE